MNTNMIGFFEKENSCMHPFALDESSLSIGKVKGMYP